MEYNCIDKGSDRCPCILMESGQCYTCNMIQKGKCNCGSLWQGVCPYTEYLQRNKKSVEPINTRKYILYSVKSYSPNLSVLTLETPIGFGLKCKEMGAFLMMKWKDWFLPLSVLNTSVDFENQMSYVDVAVNAVGPKTIGLLKDAMIGREVTIKGPFFSGLMNKDVYNKGASTIVIAKGIAVMPLVNIKQRFKMNLINFSLDTSKLPSDFLKKYLGDMEYLGVDLENDCFEVSEKLKEDYGYCYSQGQKPNVFLMVSPYYAEKILKQTGFGRNMVIMPNHSNMCCGEGYCGSCSFIDRDGVIIKRCKCIDGQQSI